MTRHGKYLPRGHLGGRVPNDAKIIIKFRARGNGGAGDRANEFTRSRTAPLRPIHRRARRPDPDARRHTRSVRPPSETPVVTRAGCRSPLPARGEVLCAAPAATPAGGVHSPAHA